MHTIKIFARNGMWMATFSDPEISELFGTDTIETAYTTITDRNKVLAEITDMNPDRIVTLK